MVEESKLTELMERVRETNSDAFLLLENDNILSEWYSDKSEPIELMSSLKSVVTLIIGRLLYTDKLTSLDQTVAEFYPEWRQGNKQDITIRHLMNHTSGIQNVSNAGSEIYPAPDIVQLVLAAELDHQPGKYFSYNNKAVNLLSGIVTKITGMKMDEYANQELMKPMGIEYTKWYYDSIGNTHAMAGLQIHARDFAKFGQLVLNCGKWNETQLVSINFIEEMLQPGQVYYPRCGLLWWLIPRGEKFILDDIQLDLLREHGLDSEILELLESQNTLQLDSIEEYTKMLKETFGEDLAPLQKNLQGLGINSLFRREIDGIAGYYTEGYRGQYLVINRDKNIVAVRLIRSRDDHNPNDNFQEFKQLIMDL